MAQIRVNINGVEINTHTGHTILEVAKENGILIPTLCHDEKLKHYGSCGMCVVELDNSPRLIRSCSTQIANGMVIQTDTNRIKESRKTTLELMLSDHEGDCKAPCMLGCPSNVDVQGYVGLTANKEYEEALKLIKEDLPLPASIGRVCPHPCQTGCRRGIVDDSVSIAWIKRYVADLDLNKETSYIPEINPSTGKRIAVIGGGPGGLSAAYFLRKSGHEVVIYEAMPELGGMLKYGIPLYRLPKEVLQKEVKLIEKMGVKLVPNTRIGRDVELDHIRKEFDAVYVSIGAWKSSYINCKGSDNEGIIGGIEFLNKFAINEPIRTGNRIAVIGGGNTAMDACRTAIRLGAKEVYAIYRRTKEDMPAVDVEIEEAEEEGVVFKFLSNPVEFISDADGKVTHMRLEKMKQTEKDASGRRGVVATGEVELLEIDSVIMSVGQRLAPEGFEAIALNQRGNIDIGEGTYMTNLEGVFAGGDAVGTGAGIAIEAVADGKHASQIIDNYLRGDFIVKKPLYTVKKENLTLDDFKEIPRQHRSYMGHEAPEIRMHNFEEVVHGFEKESAVNEASRCLECGCMDSFECHLFDYANDYDVKPVRFDGPSKSLDIDDAHLYFTRDPNKCILCGMCVRICDEVMDRGILGLSGRGFDTVVQPAFNKPFSETDCISCGQCISVCPTGALQEKALINKPVPLEGILTESVCNQCGMGCSVKLESRGTLLLRSLPKENNSINKGLLCKKGRFDLVLQQNQTRIKQPMVRKNGILEEVSWDEAILYIARKSQSLNLRYGDNTMGAIVSGKYFNETIYLLKKLCNETFKTENVYANKGYKKGLKDVLGYDVSTNVVSELGHTDLIITIGTDIMERQPVLGVRIKTATNNGVELIVINDRESKADKWASSAVYNNNNLELLQGIAKELIQLKGTPKQSSGINELNESLKTIEVTPEAKMVADKLVANKNAMIVCDRELLSDEAVMLIAQIAVLSGHIGKPRNGIIQLRSEGNGQGMVDLGINMNTEELNEKIDSGQVKGLIVMGNNIDVNMMEKLEFLVVHGEYLSIHLDKADVIMPSTSHLETSGTITSQDRRIQYARKAVNPEIKMNNIEQLQEIMNVFTNKNMDYSEAYLLENIGKMLPEYLHAHENINDDSYWPIGKSRVLYGECYHTEDGYAKLQPVVSGVMYIVEEDSIVIDEECVNIN